MSNILKKKINILKSEYQYLLDTCNDTDTKTQKMKELETTTKLYSDTLALEKTNLEIKKAQRINENLVYKRNTENVARLREQRTDAKNKHELYAKIQDDYYQKDCHELPGFLFFEHNIQVKYGLCPFIKPQDNLCNARREWLYNTFDNGTLYYDFYEKIINKKDILDNETRKTQIEHYLDSFILSSFTQSQIELYNKTLELLDTYNNSKFKGKSVQAIMNMAVNNITLLVLETKINIDDYISARYCHITVNRLKEDVSNISFDDNLEKYKELIKKDADDKKYIINIEKRLKLQLTEYLSLNSKPKLIKHLYLLPGKKWKDLNDQEKLSSFDSFANVYVHNLLIQPELLHNDKKLDTIQFLKTLIRENYPTNIKNKNITWNKGGYISKIGLLQWDNASQTLFLKPAKEEDKLNNTKKVKKPSSAKTILTKINEEIINEEIIKNIIANKDDNNEIADMNTFKKILLDNLKKRLKIKRILNIDKDRIMEIVDNIYTIISNN